MPRKVFMFAVTVLVIVQAIMSLKIISRAEWHAQPPKAVDYINKIVSYVIIHHSDRPPACTSNEECIEAMQSMQRFHQIERGWDDIGYTFGIGGDGNIYEGRGFNVVGAHAPNYNNKSIGICLIGNWEHELPPRKMLLKTQDLISYAVNRGYLSQNYTLYGHRQVRATTCPGDALYNEITKWPHFSENTNNQTSNAGK